MQSKNELLRPLFFTVTGPLLLLLALASGVHTYGFVQRATQVDGVVSALNIGGSSHPEIQFTIATGETISYPQGGVIFGYKPGDKVTVLYDTADPASTATLDAFGAIWFWQIMLVFLGTIFLTALPSSLRAMRKNNNSIAE
jgi:hypothetical protein